MGILLLVAAALFMLAAVYPFAIYPKILPYVARRAQRQPQPRPTGRTATSPATFSLCVSAYNEEDVIAEKARNMLALREASPGLELLVYVDGASDRTAEILQDFADEIRVIVGPKRMGKSHGMNQLVTSATGSVIIFSDANVMMEPESIANLSRYFADADVGCVCGTLIYVNERESATAEVNSSYWRLEERIKQLESRTGSVMGADGSLFAIRRHLHRPVPPDIIDDFFISMSILCDGYRVVSAPDVRAQERAATRTTDELHRKVRIGCQAYNVHRLLWPRLSRLHPVQRFQYVSHKLLRWFAGFNLSAAALTGAAGLLILLETAGLALLAGGLGILAVGLAMQVRPVPQMLEIVVGFLATSLGVVYSLFGARFQTWRPAASVRAPATSGKADQGGR